MAKKIKLATLVSAVLCAVLISLYFWRGAPLLLSLAITAGTFFYHFAMRLTVGALVNAIMHNHADAKGTWFCPRAWEKKLYARLGVRKWRERMPTYDPSLFSLETHTVDEILGANCQAEVVHEIIALLSFVPLTTVPLFGAFPVFLITSILAAAYDMLFVIMQRYARPHLLRIASRAGISSNPKSKGDQHDQSRPI
ncbi:MAG: hypothetical protein IJW40_05755 [Clostridia bacterium]|nr:hypothetical protein [Clostridia bacterium]